MVPAASSAQYRNHVYIKYVEHIINMYVPSSRAQPRRVAPKIAAGNLAVRTFPLNAVPWSLCAALYYHFIVVSIFLYQRIVVRIPVSEIFMSPHPYCVSGQEHVYLFICLFDWIFVCLYAFYSSNY